jgi:hypothetical protein
MFGFVASILHEGPEKNRASGWFRGAWVGFGLFGSACHLTSPRAQLVPGPYSPIALAPFSLVIKLCPWLARDDVKLADISETAESAHVMLQNSIVLSP